MKAPGAARRKTPSPVTPLSLVYRALRELKPDPANPRLYSKKQIRQIGESIKAFGFVVPVLTDRDGKIIAGHGRVLAARELGWSEVPALCLDHLDAAQARAFMIADNRLTEIAGWDDRLLAEQLKELSLLGLDFSLDVTGFEIGEIDLRIAALEDLPAPADDPADIIPKIPEGAPVSKIGDLWVLGPHRMLCGNALDAAAFAALMGEDRATMVFSDPPYNVRIYGHASGLGAVHHRPFPMASGEMDRPEFIAFLTQACRNLAAFSTDGSMHYLCMDWRHLGELARRRPRRLWRAEEPLRLGQGQWRHGVAVPQPARARLCLQAWPRWPSQQCPARPVWPQPQQCLALSRGQLLLALR
jgi:ParB-like chromosome segregation protein Spo0J